MISKLANCFNNKRNTNYYTTNASDGVVLQQTIYFIATAVAPSVFMPTQNQITNYSIQLTKHTLLTS